MQQQLSNFGTQPRRFTSLDAYKMADIGGQMKVLLDLYLEHPEGLTDREAKKLLRDQGHYLELARISGRRYDINKKFGKQIIVNVGGKTRNSQETGCKGLIWQINEQVI